MNDQDTSVDDPDSAAPAVADESAQDEPEPQPPEVDPAVTERRAEIIRQAREATEGRPELAELIDRVAALDDVDLAGHVEQLDAAHRALRDALAAAGRDAAGAS